MQSAAQKKARANFKKAIEYRKKTGCSLKDAFAHVAGKKTLTKKAVPKKKIVKKAAKNKIGVVSKINSTKKISEQTVLKSIKNAEKIQKKHMAGFHKIDLMRINNDTNGNPRYVLHFLDILNMEERDFLPFNKKYIYALKKAKLIGGKKFDNKQYGGGIVFQSYNINDLEKHINELLFKTPKIKY